RHGPGGAGRGAGAPGAGGPPQGRGGHAPLLRRALHRGNGRGLVALAGDGQERVDFRPRVAQARAGARGQDRGGYRGWRVNTGRVEEVFLEIVRAPASERGALLEARCNGDERLKAEVLSLLEHYVEDDSSFLNHAELEVPGLARKVLEEE